MKRRKQLSAILLMVLMIIFQSFMVYAEDSVTIKSVAVKSVNFKYEVPSFVTGFSKYVEIPVRYKGDLIGDWFTEYFKKEINQNGHYLAEGYATFRAHAYACNNGDANIKLGVYIDYLDTKGVWQNFVYYEGIDVVGAASIEDIWSNNGKYYIDITKLELHSGDEQNRNIAVAVYVKDSLGATFQDRHNNIELATIAAAEGEAVIKLQTAYRPYGKENSTSTLSNVSVVILDKTNQTANVNIDKIKVVRGAVVAVDLKGTNLEKGKYIVAKTSTAPTLPYTMSEQWKDLKEFTKEQSEWQKLYPNMDTDKQGYIAVNHYILDGSKKDGKEMINKHQIESLCDKVNETPIYQIAGMSSDKAYYTEADKNGFFQHEANDKTNDKAEGSAAIFNGYIVPSETGSYNLGLRLYGDAYGYITVNGENIVFVNETNNASLNKGMHVASAANTAVSLEAGKPYPIHIEWYDGNNKNKQAMVPCCKLTSESKYKDMPSDWFYPEAKETPDAEQGSETKVSVSDKVQLPTSAGEYYVILKLEGQDGKEYETSYGPIDVNVEELGTLAEEDRNKIVPASISNIYWETTYGEAAKKLVYTLDVSQLIDATYDGTSPMATYDLSKAVASIEDEMGRIPSSNYKITHNKKTINITFNDEYTVAAGKTHKISVFIPTKMGQQVRYDKYLKDICKTAEQVSVKLQAQEIYYNQDIVDGVPTETEAYITVNHEPQNIDVVYGEIPRIS